MVTDDSILVKLGRRLSEFRQDRGWSAQRLGDIVQFSSGGTPSKDEASYWNGNIPWISASSMHETRIVNSNLKVTPLAIGNGTRIAPKGSLLVLIRGSMLFNRVPVCIAAVDVAFNQDVKALTVREDVNPEFLLYQLLALSPRIPVNETGIGAGKIDTDTLGNLPVYLPSPPEQKKIAECLTSLEELISAQGQKVAALKSHKLGLTQKLFPRSGETTPRLRFPEFRNEADWQELKAGELFFNRIEKGDDDLPICSVTMSDGLVRRSSLDRRIDDLANAEGNKKAYKLDIAYNMMRMWQGACGVAIEECMISPAYIVLKPAVELNSNFYGYMFKLPQMLQLFESHSRGLTKDRLRLYYQDFCRIPLAHPNISEQQRISEFLESLDAKIASQCEMLQVLKEHKKGLMQQLFPSPGGV